MPSGSYADVGTTDHAALIDLDYDSAGHTGFAGTDTANIFTQPQQFTIAGLSVASLLQNSDFDSDINNWDDSGSSWTWNATERREYDEATKAARA